MEFVVLFLFALQLSINPQATGPQQYLIVHLLVKLGNGQFTLQGEALNAISTEILQWLHWRALAVCDVKGLSVIVNFSETSEAVHEASGNCICGVF